jgi:hypothetical protein
MNQQRRIFFQAVLPAALAAPLLAFGEDTFALWAAQRPSTPQTGPIMPPPVDNPFPDAPKIDPKLILKHNQQQIHDDVLKLYTLAGELKEQVGKTDSANILSLPVVQKAEEIEKLARQIKNLAKGS